MALPRIFLAGTGGGTPGERGPAGPPAAESGWAPAVAYTMGDIRVAPDGSRIRRSTSGTSRATFDATEQAAWVAVLAVPGTIEQTALSAAYVSMAAAAKNPDLLITGAITRNANSVVTSAAVVWPDGKPGTFTTDSIGPLNTIDGYHITHVDGATTVTYTQPTVTRDANGAATNVPAITVA
jgi:hypothetical protein